MGLGFEFGLAFIALGLGWLVGPWPWINEAGQELQQSDYLYALRMIALGNLCALPIILLLILADHSDLPWARSLETQTRGALGGFIADAPVGMLLAISVAAGVGEEMLFRGWLQRWISIALEGVPLSDIVAIVLASAIFGLCHALSWKYALVASVMGAYLGIVLHMSHSLLCPIAAHAAYDFLAMLWMRSRWSQRSGGSVRRTN